MQDISDRIKQIAKEDRTGTYQYPKRTASVSGAWNQSSENA